MAEQPVDKKIVYIAYPSFVFSAVSVNFLAKWGSLKVSPFELNGVRLVVAGFILLGVAFLLRINLTAGRDFWRYACVGALTMAIPQALIFWALSATASPNAAAFAEATVPGIVLVYILADGRKFEWAPVICIGIALSGLAAFLVMDRMSKTTGTSIDIALVLISAAVTALGFVLSKILPKAPATGLADKIKTSIKNNAYMTCIAGVATLVCMAARPPPYWIPTREAWPAIIALALVGTCLGWISFLLLLAEDVVLASSAIIVVPVVTAVASAAGLGEIISIPQLLAATVVIAALVWLTATKLRKPM